MGHMNGWLWCPKCDHYVPPTEWRHVDAADKWLGFHPLADRPVGTAYHSLPGGKECVVDAYVEPWWLRLLRWIVRG